MWANQYRPLVFEDVLGQQGTVQVLQARLKDGKAFDTSYIFAGGHGCGKTTLARIYARAMLCLNLRGDGNPCNECDHCKACLNETMQAFTEMDAASNGTVADMRDLVEGLAYAIPGVKKKVYLLDEAHRMSRDGQDVLLKPLEENKVVGIFCTTELAKIRSTIKSRCEVYEIRKISREDILARMKMVLDTEGVTYEDNAVLTVIDLCDGHVRDVLNKLETVAQVGPVTEEAVKDRLNLSVISTYYDILLSLGDPARSIALVEDACDRVGPDAVASGLAEAAMNSYRLAHKIHAEFAHFDRASALKVYEGLRETLPSLAEYFLRSSYVTRLHLICDVVRLAAGGVPQQVAPAAGPPPIQVQSAPSAQVQAPAPSTVQPSDQKVTPPTQTVASYNPPADPLMDKKKRADGIGPRGSSDPHALTAFDHLVVPIEPPRDSRRGKQNLQLSRKGAPERYMTPQEFRAQVLSELKVTRG